MLIHLIVLSAVSIWMVKIAERNGSSKNRNVIAGMLAYIAMALIVHFSLFFIDEDIYDKDRLIMAINVCSGLLGAVIMSFILKNKKKQS